MRWRAATILALFLAAMAGSAKEPSTLAEATEAARQSERLLYVGMLGSEWSVASRLFEEEILHSPAFQEFAARHLVVFLWQAQRDDPDKERLAQQRDLVSRFDVSAYPTVVVLDPGGAIVLRHELVEVDPATYVGALAALLPHRSARTEPSPDPDSR